MSIMLNLIIEPFEAENDVNCSEPLISQLLNT